MNSIVDNEELGRRIHGLRVERQLTLKQVEEASGLSATHLSEIERGRTSPTIGALTRIARALGRDASYFIETEELSDVAHLPHGRLAGFMTAGGTSVEPLTPGVPGSRLFAYRLSLGAPPAEPLPSPAGRPPARRSTSCARVVSRPRSARPTWSSGRATRRRVCSASTTGCTRWGKTRPK